VACFALLAPPGASVYAANRVTLLGPELERRDVILRTIDSGMMSFFDEENRLRAEPVDASVRLMFTAGQDDGAPVAKASGGAHPAGRVTLTDGQVIAGRWVGVAGQGQAIRWQRGGVGVFELSLSQVRSVVLGDARASDAPPDGPRDVVVLGNGDRLTGFLDAVTAEGVALQLPGNAEPVVMPLERVAAIYLANPDEPAATTDYRVRLTDGSLINATSLTLADGVLGFVPYGRSESEQARVSAEEVASVDCLGRGYRLTELVNVSWEKTSGGVVFGAPAPPRRDGQDLRLHAPVTLEFTLPPGARRLAGLAQLDIPEDTLLPVRWSDFVITFTTAEGESKRLPMSVGNRRVRFNLPLTGATLQLRLDAGVNGPVLDRLRLVRPLC